MMNDVHRDERANLASLCRMDPSIAGLMSDRTGRRLLFLLTLTAICLGAAVYGCVFGMWHSTTQAFYSAVKMPVLIAACTLSSALVNTMLAQIAGAKLSLLQVCLCMATGFAVTSVILASLSPVVFFLLLQCPSPRSNEAMTVYGLLLPSHTILIGAAGLIGNLKMHNLLVNLHIPRPVATRVLTFWILVTGLVGCELSWIASPFLARPDVPPVFLNSNAFKSNFFEYLWMSAAGRLTPMTERLRHP